ncbi:TatD family hydrolase [Salinimonas iocasae]|uniref:TatD family deoxyribonuclease n=1 Tax=Salinimonas iocasae TaxID=2572577 RepID=A0A5B7YGP0_9ALTE|nr:TatD family hydrolase [Salinimonas iocasae]QCZ94754.1 TatD family deoxyribonuclease [Salinimonas iocasae]
MQWFDAGVNLLDSRFAPHEVINRARENNVTGLCLITTEPSEWEAAAALYQQYPDTLCYTIGVHPHNARLVTDDDLKRLEQLATAPGVVAVGECGLDFNRDFSPRDTQVAVFKAQLDIAQRLHKPVYLHERDAFEHQIACLEQVKGIEGIAHCFTGTSEQMQAYLARGLYIGITGWLCDPKRGESLREALQDLPLDRLILETDAPYLFPKNKRPRKRNNEPAFISAVAEEVGALLNKPIEDIAAVSVTNTFRLFGL